MIFSALQDLFIEDISRGAKEENKWNT